MAALGTAVGVIGIIVKVPSYLTTLTQVNNLSKFLVEINKKSEEFNKAEYSTNTIRYLAELEEIKNDMIYALEKREISENQYKMLDDKVSWYMQNINKRQGSQAGTQKTGSPL